MTKSAPLIFLILALTTPCAAQVAAAQQAIGTLTGGQTNMVHDPANKLQLITIVEEARKTYTVVKKELELLEAAREALSKVNKFVRQVKYLDDIIEIQKEIYKLNQESINQARQLNVINKKSVLDVIQALNNNLIAMESSLNLANHLLEDDFVDMNTAERMEALQKIRGETLDYRATARYLNKQIRDIATLHFLEKIYVQSGEPFGKR
jgi:predicted transglutaminase-like cysteine proteinase